MILSGDPIDAAEALDVRARRRNRRRRCHGGGGRFRAPDRGREAPADVAGAIATKNSRRSSAIRASSTRLPAKRQRRVGGPVAPAARLAGAARRRRRCRSPPRSNASARAFWTSSRASSRKAQRHIFFAEREAAKVPTCADVKPAEIKRAAVIGAGTMGGGIAMCFANAGIPVTMIENGEEALTRGLDRHGKELSASAARGGLQRGRRCALARPRSNRHDRPCRCRRRRHRDRSGVRGHGRQARGVLGARPTGKARRGARDQHLLSRCRCDCARRPDARMPSSACTSSARRM